MPRPLTAVERGYIENCITSGNTDPKKIAKEIQGVGPVTVQAFMDGLTSARETVTISADEVGEVPAELFENKEPEMTTEEMEKELEPLEGESDLEQKARIASSRIKAGPLMDRKDGIVVMTEGASSVSDARDMFKLNELTPEQKARQTQRIHQPFAGPNQGGAKDTSTRVRG